MNPRVPLLAVACLLGVGCSSQQLYSAGQQWQRERCQKIEDRAERSRCENSVALSYQDYQAQRRAAAKP